MNPSQTEYHVKRTGTDMEIRRTVLLADANEDFRAMLRENIEKTDGFTVVGSVGDGREALRLIEEKRPDLVVARITFNGTTATCMAEISADNPTDRITATMILYNGTRQVDRWVASGTGDLSFSYPAEVESGVTLD